MIEADDRWCSWCHQRSVHALAEGARPSTLFDTAMSYAGLGRSGFICQNSRCGKPTTTCRGPSCTNMARAEPENEHHFCSLHNGEVRSFEQLSIRFDDPIEFAALFSPSGDWNYADALKKAAGVAAVAAVAVPAAAAAAPIVGGALGVAMGLSGAAATSAGLATVGFGSLASGGFGMAGGAAVVTGLGGMLGGAWGGVVANRCFSDVEGFRIERIRSGRDPALICVDGFLTQGTDNSSDWLNGLGSLYPDRAVYRVWWESARQAELAKMGEGVIKRLVGSIGIAGIVKGASHAVAHAVLPAALAAEILNQLASNPWWRAIVKAEKTGYLLAEMIGRCEDRSFILVGHSLGARVCVTALRILGTKAAEPRSQVIDAHLLGGAVDTADAASWVPIAQAIKGQCFSYYIRPDLDNPLNIGYRISTLLQQPPIGIAAIPTNAETCDKIISIDVSDIGPVRHHGGYHQVLAGILNTSSAELAAREIVSRSAAPRFPLSDEPAELAAVMAVLSGTGRPLTVQQIASEFRENPRTQRRIALALHLLARLGHLDSRDGGMSFRLRPLRQE